MAGKRLVDDVDERRSPRSSVRSLAGRRCLGPLGRGDEDNDDAKGEQPQPAATGQAPAVTEPLEEVLLAPCSSSSLEG